MSDYIFYKKTIAGSTLCISTCKVGLKYNLGIKVYSTTGKTLLEVIYPNLVDSKDGCDSPEIFRLMSIVWLIVPSIINGNLCDYKKLVSPVYHGFIEFLVSYYYNILKYEYGYDHGVPCEIFPAEVFQKNDNLSSLQKLREKRPLLSWSNGKESETSCFILNKLSIDHGIFRILDLADLDTSIFSIAPDYWADRHPGYQCVMGNIQNLGATTFYIDRLYQPYESLDDKGPCGFNVIGRPLGWNMSITQKLLAMLYMSVKNYDILLTGNEYEAAQVYRVPKGIFLPKIFKGSQMFNNYTNRFFPFPVYSLVSGFTQALCTKILVDNKIPFNSCFASRGMDYWCGKCAKCQRVKYILEKIGSDYNPTGLVVSRAEPGLLDKQKMLGSFTPASAKPVFTGMEDIWKSNDQLNTVYFSQFQWPFTWHDMKTISEKFNLNVRKEYLEAVT